MYRHGNDTSVNVHVGRLVYYVRRLHDTGTLVVKFRTYIEGYQVALRTTNSRAGDLFTVVFSSSLVISFGLNEEESDVPSSGSRAFTEECPLISFRILSDNAITHRVIADG